MDYIKWTEELSVGVTLFDNDHKKLVELINDLNQLIIVGDKVSAMERALAALVDYTVTHFNNEETLMIKHKYPAYETHRSEHVRLTDKVIDFQNRLNSGKANFSLELITFLRDWLINHIKKTDMSYRKYFNEKGVS